MRVAVVKASALGDRWDAPFHVALAQADGSRGSVGDEAERLRATWSEEEAVRLLQGLDAEILAPVQELARGDGHKVGGRALLDRAVREYPHTALALVLRGAPAAVEVIAGRIRSEQAKLDAILSLTGETTFRPGHLYPLRDPSRFDDGDGTGYDHVMLDADPTPGKRMQWAWVCREDQEVHPGFPDPVQVAPSDVDLSRGRPVEPPAPSMASR